MPHKCCVPGCRSNYEGPEYVSVFRFPSDPDVKGKWVELIGRKNYVVNKNSVVCIKHFEPHFIVTIDSVKRDDGTLLCVPRGKPKLQNDAVPTIFPHAPFSSSIQVRKRRKATKDDKASADTNGLKISQQNCIIKDSVTSFHSEIDSHIQHRMSKSNLAVTSTDGDTPTCGQVRKRRKATIDDKVSPDTNGLESSQQNCVVKDSVVSFHSLCKEIDRRIYQRMSKSNLAATSTDGDTLTCSQDRMPEMCCVPGCKSNYRGQEYLSMFRFPSDPGVKGKWLELIGQNDYVVNKNSVVCAKHFEPHFIVTIDPVKRDDGTLLCVPRTKPKLQNDAVPTIFLHAPFSSSTELPRKRKATKDDKVSPDTNGLESSQQNCVIKDSVTSLLSLCEEIDRHIQQRVSKCNLAVTSTDGYTPTCVQVRKRRKATIDDKVSPDTNGLESSQQNCVVKDSVVSFHSLCKEIDRRIYQRMSKSNLAATSTDGDTLTCSQDRMPEMCCVPGCKSNYRGQEYLSMFRFPSDPGVKGKWLELIGQNDYVVNKNSVVCAKHFEPHFIVTIDPVKRDDGTLLCVPRTKPKLQNDAVPTIFLHAPFSSSTELPRKRKATKDDKVSPDTNGLESSQQNCVIKDSVTSLLSLCEEIDRHIQQRVSKCNLAVTSTDGYTPTCVQDSQDMTAALAYVTQNLEFLEQQKRYMHLFTDHYINEMITEGKSWAKNPVIDMPGFTEMCQSLDKAVELLCRMCKQLSSMYYCSHCSTVFSHHHMLYKHLTEAHSSGSSMNGHANVNLCTENSSKEGEASVDVCKNSIQKGEASVDVCTENSIKKGEASVDVCTENSNKKCQTSVDVCAEYSSEECEAITNVCAEYNSKGSEAITNVCAEYNSKGSAAITNVCAEYSNESVNKGGCHPGRLLSHKKKRQHKLSFQCDICDARFDQSFKLIAHTSKHTGVKPFLCDLCGAGFTVRYTLHIHMRTHTGEKPYVCDDCGAKFANRRKLNVHRISHTGEKPYKCDVCQAGFNQAFTLQLHKRKHTGEQPYNCDICGLKFARRISLNMHKGRHFGFKKKNKLKQYQCDFCDRTFSMRLNLLNHRRKHTGETPYSCDICGLRFSVITSLQTHRRKHTGEKPYLCDICGTGFAHRGTLLDHKRLHTGEKPYKCGLCGVDFSNHKKLERHRKVHSEANVYTSAASGLDLSEN